MKNFLNFIKEELRGKISNTELEETKIILVSLLEEYKIWILENIKYDIKSNKISFNDFENIDVEQIVSELNTKIGYSFVSEFNVESFLRQIHQVLELKKRETKKLIKDLFIDYYISLDERTQSDNEDDYTDHHEPEGEKSLINRKTFEKEKYNIQVELLKLQEWVMKNNKKVAIVFEGRDAAGKGSTISRFVEYLNPKGFKVVALGMPTEEEKNNWFERYEKHLPTEGQIAFFDRSWYNRAVVEPSMGYCSEEQYEDFMNNVLDWEESLIKNGIILIKLWFSITKEKQLTRFDLRKSSPLKYWKFSPNDAKVVDKWDVITKYKNQMFVNTSNSQSPWVVINTNDKKIGVLNAMRYVLWDIDYDNKNDDVCKWYPEVVNIIK